MPLSGLSSNLTNNGSRALRFTKDGTFKISIFSDLHYGESQASVGPENDAQTGNVMSTILANEQPQLAVLNGDLITGDAGQEFNISSYVDHVIKPLVDRNVSWASAYGNHDNAGDLCSSDVFERETRYQNSLTMKMVSHPSAGVTNYYLPVFSHNMSAEAPEVILWFFDSKGGNVCTGNHEDRPTWVHQSVIDWFIKTHSQVMREYGRVIPSLAFFHIPTYAMRAFQITSIDEQAQSAINDDIPVKYQGHTVDYAGQDIPFMEALLQAKGLLATFSGHDHGNDWCFNWNTSLPRMNLTGDGLYMCYGRRTGYGGYGDWARGSRQVLLQENIPEVPIKTWIRLEDGTDKGEISLSPTYSQNHGMESQGNRGCVFEIPFLYMFIYLCVICGFL